MRIRLVSLSVLVMLWGSALAPQASAQTAYYLYLGDSLAQGVQPQVPSGTNAPTNQGYVDDLYAQLLARMPRLQLAKLGCPGETTGTMINGGTCPYALGAQLAQAADFLVTHDVLLVTIDIGANNIDGCVTGGAPNPSCVANGVAAAAKDLPVIMQVLRWASPTVPIVGMNYYDPFLAAWLLGPSGRALANASVALAQSFNATLGRTYAEFSAPVADVEGAFMTPHGDALPGTGVPVNTAVICAWTWMCAPSPVGPNIHANTNGYFVIAAAFVARIGPL
jgi:lysophospholipase L1-like esterase